MKTTMYLILSVIIIAFVLMGCQTKNVTGPALLDENQNFEIKATASAPDTYTIWAGQTINAGTLSIWNDINNIYVKFDLTGGWMMEESHVQVATSLAGIPMTSMGIPIPGQFDYSTAHSPAVITYTYTIPNTYTVGQTVIIAAHASVVNNDYNGGGYQQETGWGGNVPGDGPRWWYYVEYVVTEDTPPPPPVEYQYETAMTRMYDNPTDFTYRWIMGTGKPHAWFSYVKSYPAMAPQTYYFYAGQSNKAGEVQIWKDGSNLKVKVDMLNGWELQGTHLKIQLTGYVGSPSFGLFPYTSSHDPVAMTHTYTVPWNSAWTGQQLNIALHGDVRKMITP